MKRLKNFEDAKISLSEEVVETKLMDRASFCLWRILIPLFQSSDECCTIQPLITCIYELANVGAASVKNSPVFGAVTERCENKERNWRALQHSKLSWAGCSKFANDLSLLCQSSLSAYAKCRAVYSQQRLRTVFEWERSDNALSISLTFEDLDYLTRAILEILN